MLLSRLDDLFEHTPATDRQTGLQSDVSVNSMLNFTGSIPTVGRWRQTPMRVVE
jgi:hypothetical protein